MKKNKVLAVIPARGGSKRLPRKNALSLAGKPLIAWTIEAALKTASINRICVSTDDTEIGEIALSYGADVPFVRPPELASDTATSVDVILHALEWYRSHGEEYDVVILLQPTSPLRSNIDIENAISLFNEKKANSVISVCEVEHSPLWANILPSDGSMESFLSESILKMRSQDLPTYYRLNGAIYISKTKTLLDEKKFIATENSFAYIMKQENSIDIDTIFDFKFAESFVCQNY